MSDESGKHIAPLDDREWLRVTLASIGDAVIATDAQGRVTLLNPIAEALTGWTEAEAKGRTLQSIFQIVNETTRGHVEDPVAKVLATGRIVGLANHTVLIARDGTERAIDDSGAPIRDRDGNIGGVVLVFRDVSEQRKAERSMRFLASLVESSDDAIIGKDVNGIVTSWNQAAERMFGYSAGEILGRPISVLAPPERPDEMPGILARIRRGERIEHFDTIRRAKDGRLVPISLTISPIVDEDGNVVGASKIARDITERKRAEAALAEEKERLRTTLVSIGDAVIVTDVQGIITLMNPIAQSLTAWPENEAIGRPLEEVFHIVNEETRRAVESPVARVIRENTVVGLANHTLLIAKDGAEIPIDDSGAPVRNADGEIVAVVLVFRDIKARRRAENRLRLLWEAASVLLTSNEPETMLREVFDKIGSHLGLDVYFNYMVNEKVDALHLVSYAGIPAQIAQNISLLNFGEAICGTAALERRPIVASHIQQSNDPNATLVKSLGIQAYVCNPLHVADHLIGTLSFGSRSRERFDEEELEFLRTISHYVAVAYDRLKLVKRLREADRRKDEFLATLAHELRNPLAPIRTGLELIARLPHDAAIKGETYSKMDRQIQHLTRLVDDLLDVSRINSGKVNLRRETLELTNIINSAVEASRPFIDERSHKLTVVIPQRSVLINGDAMRIAQAISNLLNNAAKYSEKGSRIWLTAEPHDRLISISVRDMGIGIESDQLAHIFEMFSQAKPALERAQGGLGIGLSLVKGLIELHGGTVRARSAGPGKGSEFTIYLPTVGEKSQPFAQQRPDAISTSTCNFRILVVDDNQDAADTLKAMLGLFGHEVQAAYDGLEAVQAAAAFRPEVILLDIGLPKMNGYEAARHIRTQVWGKQVSLIALSGWGQEDDKRRATEAGFDHHLTKPVEIGQLQQLLATVAASRDHDSSGLHE